MLLNKEAMQTALNNKQIIIREGKPHCVKCDTMLLKTSGDFSTFVNCECFQQEIQDKLNKKQSVKEKLKVAQEKKECFKSERAFACTFENDNLSHKETSEKMQNNYIKHFDTYRKKGTGLLLYGDKGTGKTFLARAVLHRLIEQGKSAKELNLIDAFYSCSTGEQKRQFIKDLTYKDIVLIDDIGTERNNDAMIEFVYLLVTTLHDNNIPTIYTTNLAYSHFTDANIETNIGRIYSRIIGNSIPLELKGNDQRKENVKAIHKQWLEFSEQK